jgi:hypothetical protein
LRACLSAVVGLFASAALAQPPHPKADLKLGTEFTAFPDLNPPPPSWELKMAKDDETRKKYEAAMRERPMWAFPADLPKDPTPLQRVLDAQVREGLTYLARVRSVIEIGRWDSSYYSQYVALIPAVYRAAAEAETTPAGRVRCYELRVIGMKEGEKFIKVRVQVGTDPPQLLDEVAFRRLAAEADLLRVKAEVGEVGRVPDRRGFVFAQEPLRKPGDAKPAPAFTAFPDLKPTPVPWDVDPSESDPKEAEQREIVARQEILFRLAPGSQYVSLAALKYTAAIQELLFRGIPADLPAYPTPLQKVRHEQVLEGLEGVARVHSVIQSGRWDSSYYNEYLTLASEVLRVAAELETTPAGRVRCYEARVILLKEIERFIGRRARIGSDPPQNLNAAAFWRLAAEADLLRVRAAIGNANQVAVSKSAAPPGQPQKPDPAYTAFPYVKPPDRPKLEGLTGDEVRRARDDFNKQSRELETKNLPPKLPNNPTLLQRVRHEQICQGVIYATRVREVIEIGRWDSAYYQEYVTTLADLYRVAAEYETSPSARIEHLKTGVVVMKEVERFITTRVQIGTDPPQRRNSATFHRLQMEAELLEELGPLPVMWDANTWPGNGCLPAASCCPAPGGFSRRHR